jgi:glycogen synthase
MRGLRTLQVGKGWFPEEAGGLNRYYHELLRHLPEAGVRVMGLVTGTEAVWTQSGGAVLPFAPRRASLAGRLRAVRRSMLGMLRLYPDSLCVAHFALYAAPWLDLLDGRPLVVHFHGPWAAESRLEGAGGAVSGVKHLLERRVYRRGTRCIVLSHAFGRVLVQQHAVPADRVSVVPGGVDTLRFLPGTTPAEARRRLGWPTDRPILLVVRRLVRRMGLEDLIQAVAIARTMLPDLLLLVAGTGPLRAELERRAAASAARHVRFLGYLAEDLLPTAYRAADLTVVPSVALEGFGLTVPESLASGTPVLVTDVGGLPETVAGLSPELVVSGTGPGPLALALGDAMLGRVAVPSAEACVDHARAHFDWRRVAARIGGVYREVMA